VLNADLATITRYQKLGKTVGAGKHREEGFQLLASNQYDALLLSKLTGKQTLEKLGLSTLKHCLLK